MSSIWLPPLPITEEMHALVRRVLEYALAERNYFQPTAKLPAPFNNPNHVVQLHQYRCVFAITRTDGKIWRHLTIGTEEKGRFVAPIVLFTLAQMLFGFTGWNGRSEQPPREWGAVADKERNCVVLVQEFHGVN